MTLGDRIAVMRAGILQQVGQPTELYARPVNLFVAGFIGSPSMNFLPGELDGDSLRLPIGTVRLSDSVRRALESGPGGGRHGIVAGLRPEDFEDASLVSDAARGHTFKTKIDVLEAMGSEYYAYFMLEAERVSSSELDEIAQDAGAADLPQSERSQIVARLDAASRVRQGQEIELWFNTDHLHLFDLESGRSLLSSAGGNGATGGASPATASGSAPGTASNSAPGTAPGEEQTTGQPKAPGAAPSAG
jgi:multiple sugar transport system ATP-binding protein